MDGKGRALDNVFIERFWRSLKQGYIYLNPTNGGMELFQGVKNMSNYIIVREGISQTMILLQMRYSIRTIKKCRK